MDCVALRYGNVYGPRQDPLGEAGVVAIFANRLLKGAPLGIHGDGEQTRDYVYVGDVSRANLTAAEMVLPETGGMDARAFNVATGVGTSVNELARTMEQVAGTRTGRVTWDARPGELRHSALAIGRISRRGWTPTFGLRRGLSETLRHIAAGHAVARVG